MAKKKGVHPNSLKNLNKIKPGEVRSPNGRGKGTKNRSTILKELLKLKVLDKNGKPAVHPLTGKKNGIVFEELIDVALLKKAATGNIDAIREIKDTMYGKITEVQQIIPPDVTKDEIDDMTDAEAAAAYDAALNKK
jgi:hypothetical protein